MSVIRAPLPDSIDTRRVLHASTCLAWCNGIILSLVFVGTLAGAILVTPIPHLIDEIACGDVAQDNAQCCLFFTDYHVYKNDLSGGLQLRIWILFALSLFLLLFFVLWACTRRSSLEARKDVDEWRSHINRVRWLEFTLYVFLALYLVWAAFIQNHLTTFIATPEFFQQLIDDCLDPLLDNPIGMLDSTIENRLRYAREGCTVPALILAGLSLIFLSLDRAISYGMAPDFQLAAVSEKVAAASAAPSASTTLLGASAPRRRVAFVFDT